ncbi:MAG: hypothetical protein IT377_00030 [Polyangiaceae bacterium]|nr:hypothetical protein [Polyangiaceae bacterium]
MSTDPRDPAERELQAYHRLADTVGLVPNIRRKDNLLQAAIVGGGTLPCVAIGAIWAGGRGALIGALIGLVGFGLISGLVIMVLGLVRAQQK